MKLRKIFLIALTISMSILFIGQFILTQIIIRHDWENSEKSEISSDLRRAEKLVNYHISEMDVALKNGFPEKMDFPAVNSPSVVLIDNDGNLIFSDIELEGMQVLNEFIFRKDFPSREINSGINGGIVFFNDNELGIAVKRAFRRIEGLAEEGGWFILIGTITDAQLQLDSEFLGYSIFLEEITSVSQDIPGSNDEVTPIIGMSSDSIKASIPLFDINGSPIAVLTALKSRASMVRQYDALRNNFIILVVYLIIVGIVVNISLSKRIFNRIEFFVEQIRNIRSDNSLSVRTELDGNDEIKEISTAVNELLDFQEISTNRLEKIHRELEHKVEERTSKLNAIIDTAMDGIIVINLSGKIISYNQSAQEILGYIPSDIIGRSIEKILAEPYKSEVSAALKNFKRDKPSRLLGQRHQITGIRKGDKYFPMEIAFNRTEIEDDIHFVAVLRDFTFEFEVQNKIRSEKEKLEKILETSPIGVGIFIGRGVDTKYVNTAMKKFGLYNEVNEKSPFLEEEQEDEFFRVLEAEGSYQNFETRFNTPSGIKDVLVSAYTMDWEGEQSIVAWNVDITDRKAIEDELAESKQKYQHLVEELGNNFLIYSHAPDGTFLFGSEGFKSIFALEPEKVVGQKWMHFIEWLPGSVEIATESVMEFINNKDANFNQFEMKFRHPDGSVRIILVSHHPVRDENGAVLSVDGIVENITEKKIIQKELDEKRFKYQNLIESLGSKFLIFSHDLQGPNFIRKRRS